MNSELKSKKQQKEALITSIKNQLDLMQISHPNSKQTTICLPSMPDMNENNIKPLFFDVLGYTPKISDFQVITSVPFPVALISVILN